MGNHGIGSFKVKLKLLVDTEVGIDCSHAVHSIQKAVQIVQVFLIDFIEYLEIQNR